MDPQENFYGTIILGVTATVVFAAGAYWMTNPMAFKAVVLTAVLACLTQAVTTAQVKLERQVLMGLVTRPGDYGYDAGAAENRIQDAREHVRLMFRIAKVLWLLTTLAGAVALSLLLLGV